MLMELKINNGFVISLVLLYSEVKTMKVSVDYEVDQEEGWSRVKRKKKGDTKKTLRVSALVSIINKEYAIPKGPLPVHGTDYVIQDPMQTLVMYLKGEAQVTSKQDLLRRFPEEIALPYGPERNQVYFYKK